MTANKNIWHAFISRVFRSFDVFFDDESWLLILAVTIGNENPQYLWTKSPNPWSISFVKPTIVENAQCRTLRGHDKNWLFFDAMEKRPRCGIRTLNSLWAARRHPIIVRPQSSSLPGHCTALLSLPMAILSGTVSYTVWKKRSDSLVSPLPIVVAFKV